MHLPARLRISGNHNGCPAIKRTLGRHILLSSILATAILPLFSPRLSFAEQLTTYTFGPNGSTPGVLTPTTIAPNLTATSITADAGLALDLGNPATAPTTTPFLRTTFVGVASTTVEAAFTNNADFKFTLTANAGYLLNLATLAFDAMRGGASTGRGYAVRSSVDGFASVLSSGDIPTVRPNLTPILVDLSAPSFQGLSSITFKIYSYSPATGSSVDYDSFVVNGTTSAIPTTGYVWVGLAGGANWDTTSANWSGLGTIYQDATLDSNVFFEDGAATGNVIVSPASLAPNSITFNNATLPYTISGSSLNVASSIIVGGNSTATFTNTVSAANVTVNSGELIIGTGASVTTPVINIPSGGTMYVLSGAVVGSESNLTLSGNLNLSNTTQSIADVNGLATGVLTLNSTQLTVTGSGTYAGRITGNGSLIKNTGGTLVLSGTTSDFSGGTTVSAGVLQLASAQGAGTGTVTVSNTGILNLSAAAQNAINLAGGTIGVAANTTIPGNVTVTSDSTVKSFNPVNNTGNFDLILTGLLQGTGNINYLGNTNNAPDSQALRLRGGVSDYSGTITVGSGAKFELQTAVTSGSQMGTGTLVVTGGTFGVDQAGTFSLINLRNNSAAAPTISDTNFGNNVQVIGTGTTVFNMLGSVAAGSFTRMGELTIGNAQTVVAASTGSPVYTLSFSAVHLNGGNATFAPRPVGNTIYVVNDNISLGPIDETVPGSGIIMNGAATLTLTGANTYTGPTELLSGTTVFAATASVAASSSISVSTGAILDVIALPSLAVPATQALTINGTLSGNTVLGGTLDGTGFINGTVTALTGGLIAPGNGTGMLFTGNLDLQAGSSLEIELAKFLAGSSPIAGSDYDSLSVSDTTFGVTPTVTLGGSLDLAVGSGIEMNDVFTIVLNNGFDPVTGTFASLPNGAVFFEGAQAFQISYADESATAEFELTGGNDVSIIAVPEPTTALLLLGGLALLGNRRRRQ